MAKAGGNVAKVYRLGCDIGGTFTDFALIDSDTGGIIIDKCLTVPQDPSEGIKDGVEKLKEMDPEFLQKVEYIIHGTTLVINTLIERKGAKTALITTKGFRDILEIRTEWRYDIYDLAAGFQDPLVPRYLRKEIDERINSQGKIVKKINLREVEKLLQGLDDNGVESTAVCLLHSYINPTHENVIENILSEKYPHISISISSKVLPELREYQRTSTTVANAYVKSLFSRYMKQMRQKLEPLGFRKEIFLMLSNGGLVPANVGESFPVRSIESGPIGGIMLADHLGRLMGKEESKNLFSFDMGGTTAKSTLIKDGVMPKSRDFEVARIDRFKKGSGIPITTPAIELLEIGAGGGSIAKINEMGLLQVGPESSGAEPGPACYGRGGEDPCVTDGDLVLGYLNEDYFLGGEMHLDRHKAIQCIAQRVAKPLNVSVTEAAWGIHNMVNENMALAGQIHIAERGGDPLKTTLVAMGGAGPVHSYGLAKKLKTPKIIIPMRAGVASSLGFFCAPFCYEIVQTFRASLEESVLTDIIAAFNKMKKDAAAYLPMRQNTGKISYNLFLDMHYVGQGFDISISLPDLSPNTVTQEYITEAFGKKYEEIYGRRCPDKIEIMNLRVIATIADRPFELETFPVIAAATPEQAVKGTRKAYSALKSDYIDYTVYDRYLLSPACEIVGPAIIEERESTTVLGEDAHAYVDERKSIIINMGARVKDE